MSFLQKREIVPESITLLGSDWSGVVSNDLPPVLETFNRILEMHGIKRATLEEFLNTVQVSFSMHLRNYGINTTKEEIRKLYTKVYGEVAKDGIVSMPYPDAVEGLRVAHEKGVPIFIVSKHPHEHLLKEAVRYEVAKYITDFRGSVDDKSVDIREFATRGSHRPESTAYVGDMSSDIRYAKQAGVIAIGLYRGYHQRELLVAENPDVLENTWAELTPVLLPLLRPAVRRVT